MSNLHASEVKPTKDDYFDKFIDLRTKVFTYIDQDFGPSKKVNPDGTQNASYWITEKIRNRIDDTMADMLICIVQARSIWVTNLYDYNERRRYINKAIGNCQVVIQEIQFAIRALGVKPGKYLNLVGDFETQIASLRNWRTSDNAIKNKMLKEKQGLSL